MGKRTLAAPAPAGSIAAASSNSANSSAILRDCRILFCINIRLLWFQSAPANGAPIIIHADCDPAKETVKKKSEEKKTKKARGLGPGVSRGARQLLLIAAAFRP